MIVGAFTIVTIALIIVGTGLTARTVWMLTHSDDALAALANQITALSFVIAALICGAFLRIVAS